MCGRRRGRSSCNIILATEGALKWNATAPHCTTITFRRSEVDLRQKLLQRDERISELKEQLAAKARALEDLRRRTYPGDPPSRAAIAGGAGAVSASAPGAKPAFRSRSPSPNRVSQAYIT